MIEVSRPLWESLDSRPVLIQGQADDCVIDTSGGSAYGEAVRVWVSRVETDGHGVPYVSCKLRVSGRWVEADNETEERTWLREALAFEDIDLPAFTRDY